MYPYCTVPEGVPAPFVTSTGQRVLITLTSPTTPNGIILEYQVERSLVGEENVTVIGVLDGASVALALVDTDTEPFTTYDYRAVAVNSAGAATGPTVNFTTPEAGKMFSLLTSLSLSRLSLSLFFCLSILFLSAKIVYICTIKLGPI